MSRIETWFDQDLKKPVVVRRLENVFNQDSLGNLIGVRVFSDGEPVDLAGSITGYCVLSDGTTVPVAGTRSQNKAYIILPASAYNIPGLITIVIKNTEGSAITTLCACAGIVTVSRTGVQIDPGQTVTDWTNQISAQLQAVQTAADNLGSVLAVPFSNLTAYSAGNYVMKDGNLYCFTTDHAAGDWNSSQVRNVKLANEVADLKSAISAKEHDPTASYNDGDLVWRNGNLYMAKWALPPEKWTSGHWTQMSVSDAILRIRDLVVKPYDSTSSYNVGDYVIQFNSIFRCRIAIPSGGETWTAGHWTAVPSIGEILTDNNSRLETIEPYISNRNENKVNASSFDIPVERYENIQYIDYLSIYTGISAYDSATLYSDDKIRFRNAPYSLRGTTDPAVQYSRFRIRCSTGIPIIGTQEIEVYLYVEDASKTGGSHVLRLQGADTGFTKYYDTALVNGWNKIRFVTNGAGIIDFTKSETDLRLYVYTYPNSTLSPSFNVWIGGIYFVKPDKANIIIIDDGPYQSFFDYAYDGQNGLRANNIPVTWAVDPVFIGDPDRPKIISQADFDSLAYDGLSEFSFHSYDGTDMTGATAEAALSDTLNCIRYLKKNGLEPERIFRAAWYHNDCTHPELANEVLDASASYNGSSGLTQFPFPDRYNIPRYPMQGRTTTVVDGIFDALKNQHSTILMYTHGISDLDTDTSATLMSYYISKIVAGVQAGWLRATTYNRMINHYRRVE